MPETNIDTRNMEEKLVDYLHGVHFEDLPADVVKYCKLLIMDSLGVTFPGSRAPGCDAVTGLVKAWRTDAGASVLIHGYKAPPPLAAMANSTMMHALDFDDTLDVSALHTFVNVLPAALATAEDVGNISGRQLITALVAGVDIICRLSFAIQRPLSWIRTATFGSFGAAAAAARILCLDKDRISNALGIVYSQSAGNAQGLLEGRLVKRMQPGFAASAGVTSAYLARAGITGSRKFLEGKYGFYNLYEGGEYDPAPVVKDLNTHFALMDLSIKPYPSCRMTHSAIDAALALLPRLKGPVESIEAIEVHASRMVTEMVGKPFVIGNNPQVDAQFSIPYTVSAALCRKDVFLSDFEDKAIRDAGVNAIADRVTVLHDPHLADKDILQIRMNIRMSDGRVYEKHVKAPLGNPQNSMDMDRCRKKFHKCIAASGLDFDDHQIRAVTDFIENLETVDDVSRLAELIRIGTKGREPGKGH